MPVADGLIVGSAIVRRLSQAINRPRAEVVREIGQFVAELAGSTLVAEIAVQGFAAGAAVATGFRAMAMVART